MKVSGQDVSYVADLANLELTPEERTAMIKNLNSILGYIDRLNQLNTVGVEPMSQVLLQSVDDRASGTMRDDVREGLRKSLPHKIAMENSPAADGTFFKVPKVIER